MRLTCEQTPAANKLEAAKARSKKKDADEPRPSVTRAEGDTSTSRGHAEEVARLLGEYLVENMARHSAAQMVDLSRMMAESMEPFTAAVMQNAGQVGALVQPINAVQGGDRHNQTTWTMHGESR